jgi:hypothetical protein
VGWRRWGAGHVCLSDYDSCLYPEYNAKPLEGVIKVMFYKLEARMNMVTVGNHENKMI